ncbi:MAG: rod shape-determining protein RodA [Candidatus Marinimicrobia bacterium]|nr:rod shape-determining protein RodA [Candidatus Neomarinimicrobiota bacterium]
MRKFLNAKISTASLDYLLLIPMAVLLLMGGLALYSTAHGAPFMGTSLMRQMVWLGVGLGLVWTLQWVDPRTYYLHAYRFYAALLALLLLTYFMPTVSGGHRWLFLGPMRMQPSELGKIIIVFAMAKYLTDYRKQLDEFLYALVPLGMAIIPAVLIIGQPDLGTALIIMMVAFSMMYWSGISLFYLFVIIAPLISIVTGFGFYAFSFWMAFLIVVLYLARIKIRWKTAVFLINAMFGTLAPFLWNSLQPYQQQRIMTVIDATADPHGAGYQVLQSRTAIGSGGLFGKGLGEGTQTQLRFLPVTDTDFIIAVIGEEFGFIAILLILIMFVWLLLRLIDRASTTQYRFASLSVVGFASIFLVHIFVNMGMSTGLMPVTGLPLPFLSYGGSFLLTCILMIGLTQHLLAGEPL